ncbi:LamG-like jellyroll fold domain-containing protein [Marinifilum fragile]|uniref:LamG-like jellyroll fold domain-containing protein n=1 Tax=Marinifilum fragile TaxID=570161 RepID=UPI002AA8F844|nr:LamG-like jellyroll fold domain-containing protein [Marinifilum fragile]
MIRFLRHIILSLLFISILGLADGWGQDINATPPATQSVCVGDEVTYTVFGFPGSTVEWYIKELPAASNPVGSITLRTAGPFENIGGQDYVDGKFTYTWTTSGIYTLQIKEISQLNCESNLGDVELRVNVNVRPAINSFNITDVSCSGAASGSIDISVTGGEANALNFDGTTGGVQINSWSPLYNASEFTVEGWVKLKSGNNYTSGQYSFFGQNNTVEFGIDGGNLHGWVHTRYGQSYSINSPVVNDLDDSEFHHVAFSGNRSQLVLYIDGVEVESLSVSIPISDYFGGDPSDYLRIGTGVFDGGTSDPFDGEISSVRFWKVARSQSQIFNGMTQTMDGSESGLLGAYPLSEGSGTTISGVGSFAHDGNIASGVSWTTSAPIYQYRWTKQGDASFSSSNQDLIDVAAGTYNVTVTTTNGCTVSETYTIGTDVDTEGPIAKCKDITVQLDASGNVTINATDVNNGSTDNCSAQEALVLTIDKSTFDCTNMGANVVTLTVEDQAGNQSTCTATVTVEDKEAPVLSLLSDLSIIDCSDDETIIPQVKVFSGLDLPVARYTDNCSTTFTVQYRIQLPDASFANDYGSAANGASVSDPSGFEFPEGVSTVFFRVLDASGNISNIESFTISVNHKPNPSEINF